jgi:hypothetical protein
MNDISKLDRFAAPNIDQVFDWAQEKKRIEIQIVSSLDDKINITLEHKKRKKTNYRYLNGVEKNLYIAKTKAIDLLIDYLKTK